MVLKLLSLLVAFVSLGRESAQARDAMEELPVLRANSRQIDIQDGASLHKGGWLIDPAVDLDVYEADRTLGPKTITFISDIDRLAFDVLPGRTYDFEILLNGNARCRTRISSMRQAAIRIMGSTGPDVIPFVLERGRIMVKARVNGSEPIDLLFDTGANATLLAPSAMERGVKAEATGVGQNTGLGGAVELATSSNNTIEVAGLRWEHELLLLHDQASTAGDGVLGLHMFEGKVVEFDYDRSVLILHDSMPTSLDGFTKVDLGRAGPLPTIPVTFHTGTATVVGSVIIDTGATAALFARRDFAEPLGLYGAMEKIGTGRQTGMGRGSMESDLVLLPTMTIGATDLKDVPIYLETADHETTPGEGAVLGMDVLSRFTMLLDMSSNVAYIKPNAAVGTPFPRRSSGPPIAVLAGVGAAMVASVATILARVRSKRAATRLAT
ncbi:MAG: aspartyl protease family protein [Phycisphaerae bacterium]|jgi:hypothetical protein|nr:aspartyl protease family protein [Phycisphaerae bacterium]